LTVSLQALDIASARVAAAEQVSFRPEEVTETALGLAQKLSRQMAMPLPEIDLKEIDKSPLASLHFAKALGHYYAGDMDSALMQFMRTMDLDPDTVEAHFWSGMCYQRLGEPDHAVIGGRSTWPASPTRSGPRPSRNSWRRPRPAQRPRRPRALARGRRSRPRSRRRAAGSCRHVRGGIGAHNLGGLIMSIRSAWAFLAVARALPGGHLFLRRHRVAVFKLPMKSGPAEWQWLEKGLATGSRRTSSASRT